jgi:methylmalonyl-CoA mutase N-terminal domain/subunit
VSEKSDWKANTLAKALERGPLRKESFVRSGGEPVDDVYGLEDLSGAAPLPGEFPFTRGIHSTMYRSRFWTMRQ